LALRSSKFEKFDYSFDIGYWRRYDGEPLSNCRNEKEEAGWHGLDNELVDEERSNEG